MAVRLQYWLFSDVAPCSFGLSSRLQSDALAEDHGLIQLLGHSYLAYVLYMVCSMALAADKSDSFAAEYVLNLQRIPDSRDCYTYDTCQGDTLEWLCGRLRLKLSVVAADNQDVLSSSLNKLPPNTSLQLCGVFPGNLWCGTVHWSPPSGHGIWRLQNICNSNTNAMMCSRCILGYPIYMAHVCVVDWHKM